MVQKFIAPLNDKNSRPITNLDLIRVYWSPQFISIVKRTNIHETTDAKIQLGHRLSTFEGSDKHCRLESICSRHLTQSVEEACATIVNHIKSVTGDAVDIHQMTLYFKVDKNFKLWLILCTGIKIKDDIINSSKNKASEAVFNRQIIELKLLEELSENNKEKIIKDVSLQPRADMKTVYRLNPNQRICGLCYGNQLFTSILAEFKLSQISIPIRPLRQR